MKVQGLKSVSVYVKDYFRPNPIDEELFMPISRSKALQTFHFFFHQLKESEFKHYIQTYMTLIRIFFYWDVEDIFVNMHFFNKNYIRHNF